MVLRDPSAPDWDTLAACLRARFPDDDPPIVVELSDALGDREELGADTA